jgi:hypothetical protein
MARHTALVIALLAGLAGAAPAQGPPHHQAAAPGGSHFSGGLTFGYYSGTGFEALLIARNFAGGSPLRARVGLRYAAVDAGIAVAARRVFINDNTGGTPEQSGRTWGLKLDLMLPVRLLAQSHMYAFAGPRYARFTGDYRFVGGNEDFEITSHHWGLGGGLESQYPVSRRLALTLAAGVDYFFPNTLYGHDTSYSPDGTSTNGRAGYGYSDADRAVGQPKIDPLMLVGMEYRF